MKVKELIKKLQKADPNLIVKISSPSWEKSKLVGTNNSDVHKLYETNDNELWLVDDTSAEWLESL